MSAQPIEAAEAWLDSRPKVVHSRHGVPPRPSAPRITSGLSWQVDAACRDVPASTSEAFTEAMTQADGALLAATWCARCPVADACLLEARQTWSWGLHGGVVLIDGKVAPRGAEDLRPRLELVGRAASDA